MAYQVTVPLVITKAEDKSDLYLYAGAILPARIQGAELERLVEAGFVTDLTPAEPEPVEVERPAESGPGSAKEKWLAFAASHEVEVSAEASKEDIISAVTAAGF